MYPIYLDYNSTTPMAGCVREAMLPYLGERFADPTTQHWLGRISREAIEDARGFVANLLNCESQEIIFTSGGTESVNLGLIGAARQIAKDCNGTKPHLLISTIEHAAVSKTADWLEQNGWDVTRVGCNCQGVVRIDLIERALRPTTALISIMHSNHEVGTLQPIREISELIEGRPIIFHSDASQSVGKMECNVDRLGIDMLSLSGHKMYGPKGVGALYVRQGVELNSVLQGEWREFGLRPGMENVPDIVGLGQAARFIQKSQDDIQDRLAHLREYFMNRLEAGLGFQVSIHGEKAARLANTMSLVLPHRLAQQILLSTPELCLGPVGHQGNPESYHGLSNTLAAMGVMPQEAASTVRVSVGINTTESELDRAAELLIEAYDASNTARL
jgi:cysteine desulfurase